MSNLLGRAGFTLLTVDIEDITVSYPSIFELMQDLSDMGEGNAVIGRFVFGFLSKGYLLIVTSRRHIHRDTLMAASAAYQGNKASFYSFIISPDKKYDAALHGNEDGTVPATFEVIFLVSLDLIHSKIPTTNLPLK